MSKMIGFVGSDKVEIILYFARILQSLGKKVLLQDLSESQALTYCTCKEYVTASRRRSIRYTYHDIDFDCSNKIKERKYYDYILVDFGYQKFDEIELCDEIWIFTDIQCHNIMRLKEFSFDKNQKRILIIKDFVNGKISKKYIMSELENLELAREAYILYLDKEDFKLAIDCQYNNLSYFDKLSEEYFDLFIEQLEEDNIQKKEIKKALKKIGREKNGFNFF